MADNCGSCGKKLSLMQKLSGKSLCPNCGGLAKQERKAAETQYRSLLSELIGSTGSVNDIESNLPAVRQHAGISEKEAAELHSDSFRTFLETALEDDCLTQDEEARLMEIGRVLGIDQSSFDTGFADLRLRLFVARVNDGRIPIMSDPGMILKKAEVAHMSANAQLIKEVSVREYQGGYAGVSFRVAKGVRFHTGGVRGKSVVVGTKMEAADQGILTVTSQRAVFVGQRKSIELPYSKLLNLNVFEDGVQFHLSGRANPPLLKLEKGMGSVVAATINAACQHNS